MNENKVVFNNLRKILNRKQKKRLFILIVMMTVGMVLETLSIGMILPALVVVTDTNESSNYPVINTVSAFMGWDNMYERIFGVMTIIVIVYIIKVIFLIALAWKQAGYVQGLKAEVSQKLISTYIFQPYVFHLRRNSALLVRNLTAETKQFSGALTNLFILISEIFVIIGVTLLLLVIEPLGTFITAMSLFFVGGVYSYFTRDLSKDWGKRRQHHEGKVIKQIQEGLGGIKDTILLGCEKNFLSQYSVHNLGSARVGQYQNILNAMPRLLLELLMIVTLTVLIVSMLKQGKLAKELLPVVGVFVLAAVRLMPSINRILVSIQGLRFSFSTINLLSKELDELRTLKNDNLPCRNKIGSVSSIELKKITYVFPNTFKNVLNNVDLRINKGELVGFVGATGEGKSTLIDVLIGLLKPTQGQVLINDIDIYSCMREWQKHIGYVSQHIFLIDNTLRRNIAFGLNDDQIDDERVFSAIKLAQLENFASGLPEGVNTNVGERGLRLSGGQRQRIGIARALYNNPDVLVLDEATSALDENTESKVMESVLNMSGDKTLLIIAHRLNTLKACDRIYEIVNGDLKLKE
jgi:ATP-binding cassette, subfamily B, bacterial PglK